jgi:hypothetical protein
MIVYKRRAGLVVVVEEEVVNMTTTATSNQTDSGNGTQRLVDMPEAVAIFTLGILLKLATTSLVYSTFGYIIDTEDYNNTIRVAAPDSKYSFLFEIGRSNKPLYINPLLMIFVKYL